MRHFAICFAVFAVFACGPTQSTHEDGCQSSGCTSSERCNAVTGQCEALSACTGDSDCATDERCLNGVCSSCAANIVCTAGYAACDPEKVACTGCLSDANCGGAFPLCDAPDGCTACRTHSDCGGSTPYCAQPFCVECTQDSQCGTGLCHGGKCVASCSSTQPCASGSCVNGACAECQTTSDCAPGLACHRGACRPALPGDSCRNAIPIKLGAGETIVYGDASSWFKADTADTTWDFEYDVWYSVTVTEEQALNASVVVNDFFISSAHLEIRALGDGGDPCIGRILKSGYAKVEQVFVVPGTYLIRLSSSGSATPGVPDYELKVWTTPDSRVLGNDCLKTKPLALPTHGPAELVLDDDLTGLRAMPGDYCTKADSLPDLVYAFDLDAPTGVEVTLTPSSPELDLAAAMSDQCGEDYASCYTFPPGPRTITFKRPAGKQFLHVYSLSGAGPFEMKIKLVPEPQNGACANAAPITFVNGVATIEGYPRYTPEDSVAACYSDGTDQGLHYRISTIGMGARSLEIKALEGSPSWALHSACRAPKERASWCRQTYDQLPDIANLPEGEYVLSVTDYYGHFGLELTLGSAYPTPSNETCATAEPIALSGGSFSFSGDTRGAQGDDEPQCSPRVDGGRDLFYALPITGKGRLTATLTPTSPGYNPVLMVSSDSCSFGFNGGCSNTSGIGGAESVNVPIEPWGSTSAVNFWIDGDGYTSGSFQVTGTFTPAPADDVCANATALTIGSTVTGDLSNYFRESGSRPCSLGGGGDRWYRFSSGNNSSVTLKLTSNGFDGGVAMMKVCDFGNGATCDANAYLAPADAEDSVTISVSKNTSYLVAVYARMFGQSGTYSLTLSAP